MGLDVDVTEVDANWDVDTAVASPKQPSGSATLENLRQSLSITAEVSKELWYGFCDMNIEIAKDIKHGIDGIRGSSTGVESPSAVAISIGPSDSGDKHTSVAGENAKASTQTNDVDLHEAWALVGDQNKAEILSSPSKSSNVGVSQETDPVCSERDDSGTDGSDDGIFEIGVDLG